MAAGNQPKHLFLSFFYVRMNSSLEKLIKMKVIFILSQGMFR